MILGKLDKKKLDQIELELQHEYVHHALSGEKKIGLKKKEFLLHMNLHAGGWTPKVL